MSIIGYRNEMLGETKRYRAANGRFERPQDPAAYGLSSKAYDSDDPNPPAWTEYEMRTDKYNEIRKAHAESGPSGLSQSQMDAGITAEMIEGMDPGSSWVTFIRFDPGLNAGVVSYKSGVTIAFENMASRFSRFWHSSSKGKWLWNNGYGKGGPDAKGGSII